MQTVFYILNEFQANSIQCHQKFNFPGFHETRSFLTIPSPFVKRYIASVFRKFYS